MFQAKPETSPFPITLLVDDNDRDRSRMAALLRRQGIGVLEAKTSVEALLLGIEFVGPIAALITALDLPRYCNGSELAGCLRAVRPEMRILYLADEIPDEDTAREVVRGAAELLSLPVSPARVKSLAQTLFSAESPIPA